MAKKKIEKPGIVKNLLFPHIPVLVGTNVDGKPNYITIGLIGWLCYDLISVSVGHKQYSNRGIRENSTFSVNQLSASMVKHLDYCGIYSGRKVDKSALFNNFYGELGTAPMIEECPVSIECRIIQIIERPIHTVFIGEVAGIYVDEECYDGGTPDLKKIDPIFYAPEKKKNKEIGGYWKLGDYLGQAWKIGKKIEA